VKAYGGYRFGWRRRILWGSGKNLIVGTKSAGECFPDIGGAESWGKSEERRDYEV